MLYRKSLLSLFCLSIPSLMLGTPVSSESELDSALRDPSTNSIVFTTPIALSNNNPYPVNSGINFVPAANILTIDGGGFVFEGDNNDIRGFFIRGGSVTIQNFQFSNFVARGGNGQNPSNGGGGGSAPGLGGAIFVDSGATVTLENVFFFDNRAIGGTSSTNKGTGDGGAGGSGFLKRGGFSDSGADGGGGAGVSLNQGGQNPGCGGLSKFGGGGGGAGTQLNSAGGTIVGGASLFGGGAGGDTSFDNRTGGGGGGGAGLGGAVFIREGGTANFKGSVVFDGNSASKGTGSGNGQDGTEMGTDIFVMSRGFCNFDLTSDLIMTSPIEGNLGVGNADSSVGGGLTKKGTALLSLTGDNTYSGLTDVQEGELQINGSVTSDIEVNGGTLSGVFSTVANGTTSVEGKLTLNSGRFEPGVGGTGDVTLAGTFEHNDGTFAVDITPNPLSDKVFQTAGATINGGTLEVNIGPGNYIEGTVFTVIEGPTSGSIYEGDRIVKVGPDAEFINIDVRFGSLEIEILTSRLFQDQDITSKVAKEVVKCITGEPIDPNSDFAFVVELLGTFPDVDPYLERLAPTQYGSLEWINARNQSLVAGVLSDHLLEMCCTNRNCCDPCANATFWIIGYANFADQTKKLDALKPFDSTSGGIALGFDRCCCDWIVGGGVGYTYTDFNWKHHGKGHINSFYGSLYTSYNPGCFAFDLALIGGGSDHHVSRKISFPGLSRKAKSDPWGYFFTTHLGGRGTWECGCFGFEGFALGDYHYFNRESISESGADSLNLALHQHTQHFMRGEAGIRAYFSINCYCYCFAPYIGGSWVGDFPLNDSHQEARFRGRNCVMDIEAYDSSIQMGSPEVGLRLTYDCGPTMLIGYKGLFGKEIRMNQVDVRFEWTF